MTLVLYSGSQQVARLDVGDRDQAPRSVVWGEREYTCESAVYREVVVQVEAARRTDKAAESEVAG